MTKVLTSCLSHHPASDSEQRQGEHTRSMESRWESPRPGRPGRGGPPASLELLLLSPLTLARLLLLPDPGPSPQKLFPPGLAQPPAQPLCKDIEIFFEEVVECLWDILSRKELLLLLNEFLERIKTEAGLSREEAEELHKYLDELKRALVEEDQERVPKEQLDRRRFLIKFPRVKRQLEEFIGKFHERADKVDKVHKGCTISNVVGYSTGAVSSILTIVGLALAPVTAGASVVLLATGIGFGAAAAVTQVSTTIIEHVKKSSAETEASHMMSSVVKKWKVLLEVLKSNLHIVDRTEKVTEAVQCVEMNIHAMETGKANPGSATNANIYMSPGRISGPAIQQIEAGFKATALTITKGVRIAGLATAGVFLLVDFGFLVKESKHLHDGAKTVAAESLRQRAWELERKLEELTQIYENLQEDLI
ncbi:apolipoprotein L2-like isoform X1 [Cervus elaphus]|uniref:apolipoprotein L2-like isoform X1 n=1 Tax=Cervus elaphus TaxID=9860 RepID=UPI001CC31DF1|nr:apolipoprotein L2-like isoform X1 [Cervus elaphus]XP_043736886.1 apolipoprotein L2-like isoform X1 [Cervus elaphus]XP_043736887.1 apolipoprotein L2-like isoform X1 [Cervus elaphus]XP_043736888.1 apolipoprotein L2-like isoform X1 [Cervus elaphus]XP_043736889.1 apolipoprotein L2-like isoform X1 [Cervus elaphus]XP_043736890.1 apolipoprotein L2-like isoform X1 [Cervus elaphus]XP_043736891.1 apolipoprotein L2-like isoform X1 [Cervus elaphus]XP_043736893.1 apolipoprotein L2-like isoform X1 [Cer